MIRRCLHCPGVSLLTGPLLAMVAGLLSACGNPEVLVANDSYEPRIVVEGILVPGQPVNDIRITRNIRLGQNLARTPLTLSDAKVILIDQSSAKRYPLRFHDGALFTDQYFKYTGKDLDIDYGNSYTLEVNAEVEGRQLTTRATTTVPQRGFDILDITHRSTSYRPTGADGEIEDIQITIERSPGTKLYLLTVRPLTTLQTNFIYDNPFVDERPGNVDIDDFDFEWEWLQNMPTGPGQSRMNVFWWDLWFYSRYTIIIFAADDNYASFIQTFDEVQEHDGNFHEPLFKLEGDGIGYFGSAVTDTVMLEITR